MNSRFTICHKMPENDLRMETKRPVTLAFSLPKDQNCSAAGFYPLDFSGRRSGGDAAWTSSRAVAYAGTSGSWRRDAHTGSDFVTVSTAASIMGLFLTLPRYSRRMR